MPVGTRKVGKVVRMSIGGTYYEVKSGSITRSVEAIDVTSSESNGYTEHEPGLYRAEGTATLNYRGSAPPAIVEGTEVVVDVVFAPTTKRHSLVALITQIGDSWSVAGDFSVNVNFVSQGVTYAYTPA